MQNIVHTTSIQPKGGTSARNGACRMAVVDVFLSDISMTLRGLELTYDVADGWEVLPPSPRSGPRAVAWPAGSRLEKAIAASASQAYLSLDANELESLRETYRKIDQDAA